MRITKLLKSRAKKAGLPPGSLVPSQEHEPEKISISLFDYGPDEFREIKNATIEDCLACLKTPLFTWINICGVNDVRTLETIGRHFGLHPLLLEDIMSTEQRSKLDDYKDTIYLVVRQLVYNVEHQMAEDEQVSFVLGGRYLITFLESKNNVFAPIFDRLRSSKSRLRQRGVDYLCYTLIDSLVDNYFIILEKVDSKLANLEEELIKSPTPETLMQIQHAKREIALLRRSVWPMRDVISNFRRIDSPLVQDGTRLYLHDIYDHTIQAIETIESFRDIVSGMLDIYLSNISLRMNEIMKVLTVVATIFVPLTFIASLYGMNFEYIPELQSEYGYFAVLSVMGIIFVMMVVYFRRKGWI